MKVKLTREVERVIMSDAKHLIRSHWLILVALLLVALNFVVVHHAAAQSADPTPVPLVEQTMQAAEMTTDTITGFFDRLTQTPQSTVTRVVMVIVALVLLVAGWRVYEFVIVIAGAIVGATIASSLVVSTDTVVNIVALVAGGLIGALLSWFLYYVAVFFIGLHFGILLTNGLATMLQLQPVSPLALAIGGIIGGIVLLGLSFEFLILVSSLVGAQMMTLVLGLDPVWTLVLAVLGILVQFALTRTYKYDFRRDRYGRRVAVRS